MNYVCCYQDAGIILRDMSKKNQEMNKNVNLKINIPLYALSNSCLWILVLFNILNMCIRMQYSILQFSIFSKILFRLSLSVLFL